MLQDFVLHLKLFETLQVTMANAYTHTLHLLSELYARVTDSVQVSTPLTAQHCGHAIVLYSTMYRWQGISLCLLCRHSIINHMSGLEKAFCTYEAHSAKPFVSGNLCCLNQHTRKETGYFSKNQHIFQSAQMYVVLLLLLCSPAYVSGVYHLG